MHPLKRLVKCCQPLLQEEQYYVHISEFSVAVRMSQKTLVRLLLPSMSPLTISKHKGTLQFKRPNPVMSKLPHL